MSHPTIPPIRVLKAAYIQGTKQVMHLTQFDEGPGREPYICWITIENWRDLVGMPQP
jgi:hypothetical protein